jgi:hypothetical protein
MSLLDQMEILRHMLGMQSHRPVKEWGWRNYYNSADADHEHLRALEAQGLVEQYRPQYWRATETGMRVAGLPLKAQMKLLADKAAAQVEMQATKEIGHGG